MIDAHQHFWALGRGDYAWPNADVQPIFRDFMPEDLLPHLEAAGVAQTILVQANDKVAETEFLLSLAAKYQWIAGVVGWVDLGSAQALGEIDRLAQDPKLKGLRPMLQSIEQTDWIMADAQQPALAHMAQKGLRFDALIQPRHLPQIAALAWRHPQLAIVIDHAAKPKMGAGQGPDAEWRAGMAQLAQRPNICCKLSGLVTEIGPHWQIEDLQPFTRHLLDSFGPSRLIWGSDWPVLNLASDYASWKSCTDALLQDLNPQERAMIFGENARRFYGI